MDMDRFSLNCGTGLFTTDEHWEGNYGLAVQNETIIASYLLEKVRNNTHLCVECATSSQCPCTKWYRSFRSVLEYRVVAHHSSLCPNVTIASSTKNGVQIHTDVATYLETRDGKITVLNVFQVRKCRWPTELLIGGMKKYFIQPDLGLPSPVGAALPGYRIPEPGFWAIVPFTSRVGRWCPGTNVAVR